MKSETEEKYQHYVNTLNEWIQTCDDILSQVDETLHMFKELQLQHQAVATRTKTLHDACDRLVRRKQFTIGRILCLFAKLSTTSVLSVGMICSHVLSVLKGASSQVQTALRSSSGNKLSVTEGVEASVIYVRFKAAASELKHHVVEEIESRLSRMEHVQILAECHRWYCEQRLSLVCQLEQQPFGHFFPSSSEGISILAPPIDPLSTYLDETLRPKLIDETDIDLFFELVDVLKVEVFGE